MKHYHCLLHSLATVAHGAGEWARNDDGAMAFANPL